MRAALAFAALLLAATQSLAVAAAPAPLARAHAHNDYEHPRPLLDALDHGFTSVEADIWLVEGQLLVAHDPEGLKPGRTLQALYLDPLAERVRANGGWVYPEPAPFQLLIDIKSEGEPTYRALAGVLQGYAGMLTTVQGGRVTPGPVTAVVSGNRPRGLMAGKAVRHAGYDGRLPDLGQGDSASFMPLVSDNWTKNFAWTGAGAMPAAERAKLRAIVAKAHAVGQRVRFWATPDAPGPEREAVWRELAAAGVDHVNTDDLAGLQAFLATEGSGPAEDPGARFERLTRSDEWARIAAVAVAFPTHHPQGFAAAGDALFLSSVEIIERTQRFPSPQGGYDRTPGKGRGHLFKMDREGRLLGQAELGEGDIYHPGGIDHDGRWLWVPVGEYRPDSASIVYRIDSETLEATEVLRVRDHIGGVVFDPATRTLHGVSWGSRRFYAWRLDEQFRQVGEQRSLNPSHYVDYQDCALVASRRMLCSGVAEHRPEPGAPKWALGGLDLVDLAEGRPVHQVPVLLWTESGEAMTRNPVLVEPTPRGLRALFMPEDDRSTLYTYEVAVE